MLFAIITAFFLWSCTQEIELAQPDYQKKIVVDGWIEAGGMAHVLLTLSSPFLTEYDSASIRKSFLNYAKITVTCSDGKSEVLTLFRENQLFPPFVYRTVEMKGEVGKRYDLTVEVFGRAVTAATTIPEPPSVQRITMDPQSDSSGIVKVVVKPDPERITRAFVQVKSVKVDVNFHPDYTPMVTLSASSEEQVIPVWRSREKNFYLINTAQDKYSTWPKLQYSLSDTIMVKIGTVDEVSFDVLRSLFNDQSSKENPFAFSGSFIQTNITGGIGRWTGIGTAPIQVLLPSR